MINFLEDYDYIQLYSIFVLDRVPKINEDTGEQLENILLNPFSFFSKLFLPKFPYQKTIDKDLANKDPYILGQLNTFRNMCCEEIEILSPVEVEISEHTGYVIAGVPYKVRLNESTRIQSTVIQLRDNQKFMDLLLFLIYSNFEFTKELSDTPEDRSLMQLSMYLTWEMSSYLFTEIYYKDAAIDPLYTKDFRRKKFQRILVIFFTVYVASTLDNRLVLILARLLKNSTLNNTIFDGQAKPRAQFIMEDLIQSPKGYKHSIFSSLT